MKAVIASLEMCILYYVWSLYYNSGDIEVTAILVAK